MKHELARIKDNLSRFPFTPVLFPGVRDFFDDPFFDQFFQSPFISREPNKYAGLDVDMYDEGDSLVIKASAPGLSPNQIDIKYDSNDNTVTISSEDLYEKKDEKPNFYIRERRLAQSRRILKLPYEIDTESFDAIIENGVVTITANRKNKEDPKTVLDIKVKNKK